MVSSLSFPTEFPMCVGVVDTRSLAGGAEGIPWITALQFNTTIRLGSIQDKRKDKKRRNSPNSI